VHGCMATGEKYDGQGGDKEVVEADLLGSVDVSRLVQVCQGLNCIFCQLNNHSGVVEMLLYRTRAMQYRPVDQDTHLIRSKVE